MAGTWSLRVGPDVYEGLTLFRLEALVRSGTLEGHHLVRAKDEWVRVEDVPYLRRHLKSNDTPAPAATPKLTPAAMLSLPANVIPLTPAAATALLNAQQDRSRPDRFKRFSQALTIVVGLVFLAELILLAKLLQHAH